jgi:hypothetical protein
LIKCSTYEPIEKNPIFSFWPMDFSYENKIIECLSRNIADIKWQFTILLFKVNS